jgi:aminobenzoyl-glutamate transport protein
MSQPASTLSAKRGWLDPFLDFIEWAGNRLPDPAVLFLGTLLITWGVSAALSGFTFTDIDPRTGKPIVVVNQLTGTQLVAFLVDMVPTFTGFHPLGVVLVALLGVGVAEHTGFVAALIKGMMALTPQMLLTPMVLLVAIISHSAGDTGYVLVIPLGGVIFATAGRHPLAGVVAAFAGVSGGFSANFLPSGLDPLLQGLTQTGAQILDPSRQVNPLCNLYFTAASCLVIVGLGWYITDRIIEPRLWRTAAIDGDPENMPTMQKLTWAELWGMLAGLGSLVLLTLGLIWVCLPPDSPFRSPKGEISSHDAPLMKAIVPLIFLFFLVPGVVHGYVAGTVKSHRDIIQGMSKSMSTMGYYLVLVFFAALFIYAFNKSNLGLLLAVKGAGLLQWLNLPGPVTIIGIILLSAFVNLLIGSASAKWALLAPIFVPMLMQLGISPELTQAAYRVGDSSTNIITPLMPYFPLIVVYCQRYTKSTGIGNLVSYMLPYSLAFLVGWMALLVVYWQLGLPLGVASSYEP